MPHSRELLCRPTAKLAYNRELSSGYPTDPCERSGLGLLCLLGAQARGTGRKLGTGFGAVLFLVLKSHFSSLHIIFSNKGKKKIYLPFLFIGKGKEIQSTDLCWRKTPIIKWTVCTFWSYCRFCRETEQCAKLMQIENRVYGQQRNCIREFQSCLVLGVWWGFFVLFFKMV